VADVQGWWSSDDPASGRYTPITPNRILDSRFHGPIGEQAAIAVPVTGRFGVPAGGVSAVVLNVTATEPTSATYITVYPTGDVRPTASNLNVVAGQTRPNLVVARVGEGGQVSLFNASGATHLVVDIMGWFD
jgi:glucose dehydrogenase